MCNGIQIDQPATFSRLRLCSKSRHPPAAIFPSDITTQRNMPSPAAMRIGRAWPDHAADKVDCAGSPLSWNQAMSFIVLLPGPYVTPSRVQTALCHRRRIILSCAGRGHGEGRDMGFGKDAI